MPIRKENADKRHERLIADFNRMSNIKVRGVIKFNYEYILSELSKKHFYTEKYIQRLLKEKG